jgi:hypothetical protein
MGGWIRKDVLGFRKDRSGRGREDREKGDGEPHCEKGKEI